MSMQQVGIYSYDPAKQIGRGSFADVFKGTGPSGVEVAIKRIHRSRLAKESSKKLLTSEIRTMQEAQHRNVVKFLDCIDTEQHVCLVMEYCNGGNLGTYVAEKVPLSEEKIVHLLHGIAGALQCLHAKRILHRDLKPENILISYERGKPDEPVIKVADFGFARHLNQSMAETFCGSPLYMAPEVLNGDSYDARADLWSVGTILYHMMTNAPPFKADSIKKLQQKLVNRPELHYPHRYSDELRAMAESLLKVDPDARLTFAQFFGHPLFRGWAALATTKPSGVPYGDAPATPSPTSSVIGFTDLGAASAAAEVSEAAAATAAASKQPVDDRSFVLIDKAYVELGTLADDLANGSSRSGRTSYTSTTPRASSGGVAGATVSIAEQLKHFVQRVEEVTRRGSAIMSVASAVHARACDAAINSGSVARVRSGDSAAVAGGGSEQHGDVPFKERVELLLLYHMAQDVFRKGLSDLLHELPQLRAELRYSQSGRDAIQRIQRRFGECIAAVEQLRSQLPPEIGQGGSAAAEHLSIHGVVPPEELIYVHALHVCREAATAESERRDLGSAEVLYSQALDLLYLLRAQAGPDDSAILDGFIASTRRRLDLVEKLAGKLAKAAAAARRIAAAGGAGGGGGGGSKSGSHRGSHGSHGGGGGGSHTGSYSSGAGSLPHSYGSNHGHPQQMPPQPQPQQQQQQQQQFRERSSSLDSRKRATLPLNMPDVTRDRASSFGGRNVLLQGSDNGTRDRSSSFGGRMQRPSPPSNPAYPHQHQQRQQPRAYYPDSYQQQQRPLHLTPYAQQQQHPHQQQQSTSSSADRSPSPYYSPEQFTGSSSSSRSMHRSGATPDHNLYREQFQRDFAAGIDRLASEYGGQNGPLPVAAVPAHLRQHSDGAVQQMQQMRYSSSASQQQQHQQHQQQHHPQAGRLMSDPLPISAGGAGPATAVAAAAGLAGSFGSTGSYHSSSLGRSPPGRHGAQLGGHPYMPPGNSPGGFSGLHGVPQLSHGGYAHPQHPQQHGMPAPGGSSPRHGAPLYAVRTTTPSRQSLEGVGGGAAHGNNSVATSTTCPRCHGPFTPGQKFCAECGSPNTGGISYPSASQARGSGAGAALPPAAALALQNHVATPFTVGAIPSAAAGSMDDDDLTPFAVSGDFAATAAGSSEDDGERPVSSDLELQRSVTIAKEEKVGQLAEVERLKEEVARLKLEMSQNSNATDDDDGGGTTSTA